MEVLRPLRAFVLVGACLAGGLVAGRAVANGAYTKGADPYAGLDTLARALTTVERHYVDSVDARQLVYRALSGLADHLDPHSTFLDPEDYAQLQARTEGRFFGLGIELREGAGPVLVTRVLRDGPADLAGVRSGDRIVAVDGADVSTLTTAEVAERLSGPIGEPVKLGLDRQGARLDLAVVRDKVVEIAVDGQIVEPGVVYLRIEHFRRRVGDETRKLLKDLAAEGGRPLDAVILDVRDNPGGLLDEAVDVVDLFVRKGTIVDTLGRDGAQLEHHAATDAEDDLDARLVVLVDGDSASAAEIVAGALQDLERATIVGSPTYGKGSVQQVYEFEDGSALKLTVARYALPSGRLIEDKRGIDPDLLVGRDGEAASSRLRARIADIALDPATRAELLALLDQVESAVPEPEDFPRYGPVAERLGQDPQLQAACRAVAR